MCRWPAAADQRMRAAGMCLWCWTHSKAPALQSAASPCSARCLRFTTTPVAPSSTADFPDQLSTGSSLQGSLTVLLLSDIAPGQVTVVGLQFESCFLVRSRAVKNVSEQKLLQLCRACPVAGRPLRAKLLMCQHRWMAATRTCQWRRSITSAIGSARST